MHNTWMHAHASDEHTHRFGVFFHSAQLPYALKNTAPYNRHLRQIPTSCIFIDKVYIFVKRQFPRKSVICEPCNLPMDYFIGDTSCFAIGDVRLGDG